jgi:hypothetical protein
MDPRIPSLCLALSLAAYTACGSSGSAGDPQTPPADLTSIESWLSAGSYKSWHCEPSAHAARPPSVHAQNRICSNTLLSGAGPGEYPVGSSSVKELYDDAGLNVTGYAVSLHTSAGKTGDTWYWYERVAANSATPHDASGLVASGSGGAGLPLTICVACHSAAGSDAQHSGHDFVYTQVH